jgi:hypothetical protein
MGAAALELGGQTLLELLSAIAAIDSRPGEKSYYLSGVDNLLHFAMACELPIYAQVAGYRSGNRIVKKYVTFL